LNTGSQEKRRISGSIARLSGGLILASGIIFILLNTISEALYPNYSVRSNALSDLGAVGSPTRLLWDGQLFVVGLLGFLGMFFLFYRDSGFYLGGRRKEVGIIYLLPPIGSVIVSLFPENFIGVIHLSGAFVAFSFGGISSIYAYRFTALPFNLFSVILGVLSLAFTVLLGFTPKTDFGLIERLALYPYIIWNISFAAYLISFGEGKRSSSS